MTPCRKLSEEFQYKISIAKWLAAEYDDTLLTNQQLMLTKRYIHDLIWNLVTKENKTVILISSDMKNEMISLEEEF